MSSMSLTPSPSPRLQEGERHNAAGGAPVPPASATPAVPGSITCHNGKRNERPKLLGSFGSWAKTGLMQNGHRQREGGKPPWEQRGSKGEKKDFLPVPLRPTVPLALPAALQGASSISRSIPDDKLH